MAASPGYAVSPRPARGDTCALSGIRPVCRDQFEYAVPAGAAIVLHSDGLSSRWDAQALPGLADRDPLVIAAALLAVAGVHRDDAGILVLKP